MKQNRDKVVFDTFLRVNEDVAIEKLNKGELAELNNAVLDNPFGQITMRGGFEEKNTNKPTGAVQRMVDVRSPNPDGAGNVNYILAGNNDDRISRSVGAGWTDLITGLNSGYFNFAPFNDDIIFTNGIDKPFLLSGDDLSDTANLEITAPDMYSTIAQESVATVGGLQSGLSYLWLLVYTTETGGKSNPSTPFGFWVGSNSGTFPFVGSGVAATVNRSDIGMLFTDLPVSPDSRVVNKKLYRTEGNGRTFYLVTTLENTETQFADLVADGDLDFSDTVTYQRTPETSKYVVESNNRIFLAGLNLRQRSYIDPPHICNQWRSTNWITDLERNSNFEDNATDWVGGGNHTVTVDGNSKLTDTYSMKIVASGAGSSGVNYASLPTGDFATIVDGDSYRIRVQARVDTSTTWVYLILGTKLLAFDPVDIRNDTLVFDFTATAGEVGQDLEIYLSQADTAYIDMIAVENNIQTFESNDYQNSGYFGNFEIMKMNAHATGLTDEKWYQYMYTYYSKDGLESDPIYGKPFQAYGTGAVKQETWVAHLDLARIGADASENHPDIVLRRMYRTTGQTSEFASKANTFYLMETQNIEHKVALGGSYLVWHDDFDDDTTTPYLPLVTKDQFSAVAWSQIDRPSIFLAESIRQIFRDSGDKITGISDDGNGILIFKEKSIVKLYHTGAPNNWYIRKIYTEHGCDEPKSLVKVGNTYYFRFRSRVYSYVSGSTPQYISFGKQFTHDLHTVLDVGATDKWLIYTTSYLTGQYQLIYDRQLKTWYEFAWGNVDGTCTLIKKYSDFWTKGNLYAVAKDGITYEYNSDGTHDWFTGSAVDIDTAIRLPSINLEQFAKLRTVIMNFQRADADDVNILLTTHDTLHTPITLGATQEDLVKVIGLGGKKKSNFFRFYIYGRVQSLTYFEAQFRKVTGGLH